MNLGSRHHQVGTLKVSLIQDSNVFHVRLARFSSSSIQPFDFVWWHLQTFLLFSPLMHVFLFNKILHCYLSISIVLSAQATTFNLNAASKERFLLACGATAVLSSFMLACLHYMCGCGADIIRGQILFHSAEGIVRTLLEGGYYLRKYGSPY